MRFSTLPCDLPSGYVKIAIENGQNSGFTHQNSWFSIVMLVYMWFTHEKHVIYPLISPWNPHEIHEAQPEPLYLPYAKSLRLRTETLEQLSELCSWHPKPSSDHIYIYGYIYICGYDMCVCKEIYIYIHNIYIYIYHVDSSKVIMVS